MDHFTVGLMTTDQAHLYFTHNLTRQALTKSPLTMVIGQWSRNNWLARYFNSLPYSSPSKFFVAVGHQSPQKV
jgi:hypothetical protein